MNDASESHGSASAAESESIKRAFRFLNRRKWIVFPCLLAGVAGGWLFCRWKPPVFETTAKLHIDRRESRSAGGPEGAPASAAAMQDFLATQVELLYGADLIGKAVEAGNLRGSDADSAEGTTDRTIAGIRKNLVVRQKIRDAKGTYVLEMAMRTPGAEDGRRVLAALIEAYRNHHRNSQQSAVRETLALLNKQKTDLEGRLAKLDAEMLELRRSHELLSGGGKTHVAAIEKLNALAAAMARLEVERAEAESYRDALEPLRKSREGGAGLVLALSGVGNVYPTAYSYFFDRAWRSVDPAKKADLEEAVTATELRHAELLAELGEEHPMVEANALKLTALRKRLADSQNVERKTDRAVVENSLEAATIRAGYSRQRSEEVQKQYRTAHHEAVAQSNAWAAHEAKTQEFKRAEAVLAIVMDKIKETRVVEDFDTVRINVVDPPTTEPEPVSPKLWLTLLIGAAAGGLLGLTGGFGLNLLARRVDTPEDWESVTGVPVLGLVPAIAGRQARDERVAGRWIESHPHSAEAESYRAIRTAVTFGNRTKTAKCLLVTSPAQGDGKSTCAANLAISMAQNGRRVLLIDADLRNPAQHRIFGVQPAAGLAEAISGAVPFEAAVTATGVAGLDLVGVAGIPGNPAELLSSTEFDRFVQTFRDRYDHILIDSPPAVLADPGILAGRIDRTVLVVDARRSGPADAAATVRSLASLGGQFAGLIVNRDRRRVAAYDRYCRA